MQNAVQNAVMQPWIPMKAGRRIIWAVSIALAIFIAWQVTPVKGLAQGILWGLIFGGMIWLIFEGYYHLSRLLRRIRRNNE